MFIIFLFCLLSSISHYANPVQVKNLRTAYLIDEFCLTGGRTLDVKISLTCSTVSISIVDFHGNLTTLRFWRRSSQAVDAANIKQYKCENDKRLSLNGE
jgi:hypothetical protein